MFPYLEVSLRKQSTFHDAINALRAKRHLRSERRNSILMTNHYRDLVGASNLRLLSRLGLGYFLECKGQVKTTYRAHTLVTVLL